MKKLDLSHKMPRRDFLRGAAGGALAVGAGGLLNGCGGASGGGGPSDPLNPTPTPSPLPGVTPTPSSGGSGNLLMSTFLLGTVERVNAANGARGSTFLPLQGTGITTAGIVIGPAPERNVFVFSPGGDQVLIYGLDGVRRGALKKPPSGPQDTPSGLSTCHIGAIGPDGNLYVANAPLLNGHVGRGPDTIERFNAHTGAYIDTFAEVRGPFGMVWGPDKNLYVSSTLAYNFFPQQSDFITRIDGKTGKSLGYAARVAKVAFNMLFHANGNLLVTEHFSNRVQMYDVANARLIDTFADVPFPLGMAYGPDGDLYVSSFTDAVHFNRLIDANTANDAQAQGAGSILRFDAKTGKKLGVVTTGLPFAGYLAFV